ncbi:tRNA-guanine(15) transglycosylase-like protein [Xylariales sp. AK1849]|nr:tRNA-guanine(15) transglycosylase-like protein [Xylariales sp. AK1849]
MFKLLPSALPGKAAVRLGRLALPHRRPIDTPNYFGITSRGAIPHLTPDVIARHTQIGGEYLALEDFLEISQKRVSPAILHLSVDGTRPLHRYTATPSDIITVLGARRHPAVIAPMGNGTKHISIFTSTGFQRLDMERYCDSVAILRPDIVIPLADLTFGTATPNAKRQLRMVERTEVWMEEFLKILDADEAMKAAGIHVFAPLLPVSYPIQWEYLERLAEDHAERLSGLVISDVNILADLEQHARLALLPRLSTDPPLSPHHILRQVRMGVDIFTVPFINAISDAGVALTFAFPPSPTQVVGIRPLGINMWPDDHQVSLEPLVDGCICYTCTKHHRAYLHHLLNAKEMLGWTLLQIHNHHVLTQFLKDIRIAIADGSFEAKTDEFTAAYDSEFPGGTGERPRARGYHFKAEAGQPKINPTTFQSGLRIPDDQALAGEVAGIAVAGPSEIAADSPLTPEAYADGLIQKGFAKVDKNI